MKLIIFLFALTITACKTAEIAPYEVNPERFGKSANTVYENARLNQKKDAPTFGLSGQYEIMKGDKLVFEYIFVKEDNPNIADDEFTETLVFETDTNITNKTFKDGEIMKQKAIYRYLCYCIPVGELKETKGTISITRLSAESYQVVADVDFIFKPAENFTDPVTWQVDFDKIFTVK
ncbi:hypothetical protein [Jiulongibacter sediminis]|jgi:hypothetical protein|uniref:hypothetical protein n=1 Tax=Jiulongibacter sediminis TaxID=1605367 RepID=UPI0026ED8E70|nr:hypothetical protein [Jiulongibacter sediminis]